MVDEVIHDAAAQNGDAGQREDRFPTKEECPGLQEVLVGRASDGRPRRQDILLKHLDNFLLRLHLLRLIRRSTRRSDVKEILLNGKDGPIGDLGYVCRQPTHGHGFFVRSPGQFALGNSFQSLSGTGHLLIELRQECFADAHEISLREVQ